MSEIKQWQGIPGPRGGYGMGSIGVRGLFRAGSNSSADIDAINAMLQDHEQRLAVIEAYQQPAFHIELANPGSTTSQTYVMLGIDLQFTPNHDGRAIFTTDGQMGNTSATGITQVQLVSGTGVPPAAGDPITGILLGQPARYSSSGTGDFVPFSQTVLMTNIVAGTQYWVDLAVQVDKGGSILTEVEITGFVLVEGL